MESSERSDNGATLGVDNAQIQAVLAEPPGEEISVRLLASSNCSVHDRAHFQDGYMAHLEVILETAANYMWGMKKHMAADEAAWRELAKRITLLQAEVSYI